MEKMIPDQPKYKSIRFLSPQTLPPLCPRKSSPQFQRPDVEMVAAKMPDQPLELERVSMFGFGAIPNLEVSISSDAPLKRRLRPRRDKANETSNDADVVILNVKPRQGRNSSAWRHGSKAKPSSSAWQRVLKPKLGDKMLPIEIPDSEKKASSGPGP
ncbi:hypothetical protein EsDP_00001960 [Epichloe bromicola]|uniref:Uncharacterized protein n=1 Tax=Epichloe bromicola TaxID=79588 RepID=A0ABQ0CJD0_9HYPO